MAAREDWAVVAPGAIQAMAAQAGLTTTELPVAAAVVAVAPISQRLRMVKTMARVVAVLAC
jgi:hypothetical protein